jgi:[protein]-arginine 3-hydroxylase / protease
VSEFRRHFMRSRTPVVIRGCLHGTRALDQWTPQYFGTRYAAAKVRIASPPRLTSSCGYTESTLGEYVAALEAGEVGRKYLSQWRAFDLFAELEESLPTPGYVPDHRRIMRSVWIGPANTYIGFHVDNHTVFDGVGNIFTQVYGRKEVTLVAPKDGHLMYRRDRDTGDHWHSRVDFENHDYSATPLFRRATCLQAVMEPGDALYIPPYYWHSVRSLSTSVSATFHWLEHRSVELAYAALAAVHRARMRLAGTRS